MPFEVVTNGIRASVGSMCQRGRCALRGVDCDIPHWLGREPKGPYKGRGIPFPLTTRFGMVGQYRQAVV